MSDQHQPQTRPRVLLVEDNQQMIDVFVDHLTPLGVEVAAAKSKQAAELALDAEYLVAVCDLQIPSRDGSLDAAAEHGLSIISKLRDKHPELPVVVFSGLGPSTLPEQAVRAAVAGLQFFNKSQLPECLDAIKAAVPSTDAATC